MGFGARMTRGRKTPRLNFPGGTLFNWAGRMEDRGQEKGEGFNGYSLLVNGGKGPGPQLNTLEGDPVQQGKDYTDYTDYPSNICRGYPG